MGMLIMREVMHVWGQEAYGKPVFLPLNFAVNLKQLEKIKYLKKKRNGGYFGNLSHYFKYFLLIENYLRDVFIYVKMTSLTLLY